MKILHKNNLKLEERVENLEDGQGRIESKLDRLQNTSDGFVGTVDMLRDENTIGAYHTKQLQTRINDHEKKLKHLESTKSVT